MTVIRAGYLFQTTRPNVGQTASAVSGTTAGCAGITGGELGTARRYFDPCVYLYPEAGSVGNAARNTLTGPNLLTADVSLQRDFPLGGDRRLQFRLEMFNLFNHTNFATPSGSSTSVFTGSSGRYNPSAGRLSRTSTT